MILKRFKRFNFTFPLIYRTLLLIAFFLARLSLLYFKTLAVEWMGDYYVLLMKLIKVLSSLGLVLVFKKIWESFMEPRLKEGKKKILILLLNLFVELFLLFFILVTLLNNLVLGFESMSYDLEAIMITSTLVCFLWYFTANNYSRALKEWLANVIDDRKEVVHTINSFSLDLQLFSFFLLVKILLSLLTRISLLDIFTELLSENRTILKILDSLTLLFGFMFAKRLLDVVVIFLKKHMGDSEDFSSSNYLFIIPILSNLGTISLLVSFIFIIFSINGYKIFDLTSSLPKIIQSLGILGIGLSFMAKDTVENLISGLFILTDAPFAIGDRISVNGVEGDVHDIGIRTTKLRTIYNTIITIPNSYITRNAVTSYRKFSNKIKIIYEMGVKYGTDPEKVKEAVGDVMMECSEVLKVPNPKAYFASYENYYLKFKIVFWIRDVSKRLEAFDMVNRGIAIKFKEIGIEIPFPVYEINMNDSRKSNKKPSIGIKQVGKASKEKK